ncbi:MAG: hypothetical protein HZB50_17850 [Chloroflexi bacterium]|nr:hypothetical protein [Chloroflexota bacterium]
MKPLDKHYLSLQFKNNIHSKNGNEFQSFFEDIMEKAFLDFQKIRPRGNEGDGGNDGYRKELGIYYQVYSPRTPKINEKDAAKKLVRDFQKLKNEWNEISNIKTYNFVFNDKYYGSVQLLDEAITTLQTANPSIEFNLFLAKDLENVFFWLSDSDVLGLGFNIDLRQAVENAYSYLEHVKNELDRENANFAQKILENIKDIISELNDENLLLEHEILEYRCLQKLEKMDEAKEGYENISKRFPKDSRPLLYLAEICLNDKDFDGNRELLEKAENIDPDYWLLKLEQLVRKLHLGEKIDIENIDEDTFPDDPKIKASFYRLYALFFQKLGDETNADSFIEKAVHLSPDRLNNYLDEMTLIEIRMLTNEDIAQRLEMSQQLLDKVAKVEHKFLDHSDIGARNKANLNIYKLDALLVQDKILEFVNLSRETFKLATTCYFDRRIEQIIAGVFKLISLPENELNQLLEYLRNSKKEISDELSGVLVFQLSLRDALFIKGKMFFEEINNRKYFEFINEFEKGNHERVLEFLKHDVPLAIALASTPLRSSPGLRRKIIENLPNDKNIQKDKLNLLLNFDEMDFDEAFQILKQLDLSKLDYIECRPMLQIARRKEAWDFEIIILKKLLDKEENEKEIFNLKIQLLYAYLNLKKFPEVISTGEQLLNEDFAKKLLDSRNKEGLLTNTLIACLERGKVDNEAFKKAGKLLKEYPLEKPSFEFKAGIETEIYLNNDNVESALKALVEGVKIKKIFSPQEYARLHFLFVNIGNRIDLNLDSLEKVQENTFVKLRNKDQWYFIGSENELDALLINGDSNKYPLFIDKKPGDKITFDNKYSSEIYEDVIELVFSTEKYVLWQSGRNFQNLAKAGDLAGAQLIEIPPKDDTVDIQNLLEYFEDLKTRTEPLFEMYCKNNVPLAMLAISEGGLVNAIGYIQQENKGFINFSVGTTEELEYQREIAKKIVDEKMQFYIDGTSAMFLSETGMLQKIYAQLPNLKVPQSVISLLAEITDRFRYAPGQTGHMGYAQGKITFSSIDKDKRDLIRSNFVASIKVLESNPKNIGVISLANKIDCFSETQVSAELSDACILAQKENLPVLTEDFLYLKVNELETKKKAPEYFSSWALVRVLYEEGYITFDEYLEYFGYLSSYRFRFLSLNPDDIEKAVFGDGDIKNIKPENIRRLNFPLTLSEDYGVPFDVGLKVVGIFFFRKMMDDAVELDIVEKIFVEIIESFPTKMNKKEFGERLLGACITIFENNAPKNLCRLEDKLKYQKIEKLLQVIESFSAESKLVTPN